MADSKKHISHFKNVNGEKYYFKDVDARDEIEKIKFDEDNFIEIDESEEPEEVAEDMLQGMFLKKTYQSLTDIEKETVRNNIDAVGKDSFEPISSKLDGMMSSIEEIEESDECSEIIYEDSLGNVVGKINDDGACFKRIEVVHSDGSKSEVLTSIPNTTFSETEDSEENQSWMSDDESEEYVRIDKKGVTAKGLFECSGYKAITIKYPFTLVAFGDSITDGKIDGESDSQSRVEWVNELADRVGLPYIHLKSRIGTHDGTAPYNDLYKYNIINMGCSGMRIAALDGYVQSDGLDGNNLAEGATAMNNYLLNWIRRFDAFNKNADGTHIVEPDVFVIAAGTNDVSQGSNKGTISDAFNDYTNYYDDYDSLDESKMTSSLKKSILYLQKNYPSSYVFYCTPIHGGYGGRTISALASVSELNKGVANRMNAPVIDLFVESGINGIFENANAISSGTTRDTIDGVHVRKSGAQKQAKRILSRIIEYLYL